MSGEPRTISAQLNSEGELAEQFEQFEEQNAFETRSEAVRTLLRDGLEKQLQDGSQSGHTAPQTAVNWAGPFAAVGVLALVLGELVVAAGLVVAGAVMLVGGVARMRGWL